jgi:hypothetical protein
LRTLWNSIKELEWFLALSEDDRLEVLCIYKTLSELGSDWRYRWDSAHYREQLEVCCRALTEEAAEP